MFDNLPLGLSFFFQPNQAPILIRGGLIFLFGLAAAWLSPRLLPEDHEKWAPLVQIQMVLFFIVAVVALMALRASGFRPTDKTPCEFRVERVMREIPGSVNEVRIYGPVEPAGRVAPPTMKESGAGPIPEFCLIFLAEALWPRKCIRIEGPCPMNRQAESEGVLLIDNCPREK